MRLVLALLAALALQHTVYLPFNLIEFGEVAADTDAPAERIERVQCLLACLRTVRAQELPGGQQHGHGSRISVRTTVVI